MKALITALIALLAARRITTLMTEDVITEDIRSALLAKYPPERNKFGYLLTCRKCSSVWAGVVTLLLLSLANDRRFAQLIVGSLALSEGSILVDRVLPQTFDL